MFCFPLGLIWKVLPLELETVSYSSVAIASCMRVAPRSSETLSFVFVTSAFETQHFSSAQITKLF